MVDLPIGILTSILSLLPVKSLLRFTCVSKTWHSLITSHYFSNLHLKQQSFSCNKNDRFLIVNHGCFLKPGYMDPTHGNHPSCFESIFLDSDPIAPATTLVLPPQFKRVGAQICGSCNGLIAIIQKHIGDSLCFLTGNFLYEVILWNPMINNYFTLPHVELPIGIRTSVSFGFGYDFSTDDYKVVRIVDLLIQHLMEGPPSSCLSLRKRQVMVYSLKQRSWGLPIEEFIKDKLVLLHKYGICINNHILHWIFFDDKNGMHKLRGFDLCSESWSDDLPLPNVLESASLKSEDVKDIGVLDECLCLVVEAEFNGVNVWIMKEYGVKESWMKSLSLSDTYVIGSLCSSPIAYSKNGDELLVRKGDSKGYFWFDLKNKTLKVVDNVAGSLDVVVCNGSLVPVN